MSIWFWLWLLLSLTLLGFFGWTVWIVWQQKKAWKAYAKARKFDYQADSLMASPQIKGALDGYAIHAFASSFQKETDRRPRKLTTIELTMKSKPGFVCAIASGEMMDIARVMELSHEESGKAGGVPYLMLADGAKVLSAYVSDERRKAVEALMKIKNSWVIMVAKDDTFLLRMDTPSALEDPKVLDQLFKRMVAAAKVLEMAEGEKIAAPVAATKKKAIPDSVDLEFDEDP